MVECLLVFEIAIDSFRPKRQLFSGNINCFSGTRSIFSIGMPVFEISKGNPRNPPPFVSSTFLLHCLTKMCVKHSPKGPKAVLVGTEICMLTALFLKSMTLCKPNTNTVTTINCSSKDYPFICSATINCVHTCYYLLTCHLQVILFALAKASVPSSLAVELISAGLEH